MHKPPHRPPLPPPLPATDLPFPRPQMLRVVTTVAANKKPPPSSKPATPTTPLPELPELPSASSPKLLPWTAYSRRAIDLSQSLMDPGRTFELELLAWVWRALVGVLEFLHQHHRRAEQRYLRQLLRRVVQIARRGSF